MSSNPTPQRRVRRVGAQPVKATPAAAGVQAGFIYLASQSPRRRQLLEQLGVAYELLLPGADEDAEALEAVLPGEAPAHYVKRVTRMKLEAAVARLGRRGLPLAPVLCSDTTVARGRQIFGKPLDDRDAARMLGELSGATHRVLTAVALWAPALPPSPAGPGKALAVPARIRAPFFAVPGPAGRAIDTMSESRVTFERMRPAQIARYVASGEPRGKAGAYAIQGQAAMHVTGIHGSYSGIMGLPMHETAILLRRVGLLP
jgi:septum formation protein